ncbi:MAG: RNA ligase [Candidatus Melainabacteria bacterium RIFCSPLOWO2_12_FULL_35_11]|nr:MAG: RNA ligase [Candidatus Melainabacteria bacterium RIFCSPLOWO2_12_FULL_35_11]
MRKLARIEEITSINLIPGADSIELATVKGWNVVIKKDEFKIGDKCVYFEIDSFLPVKPEFEFLRKSSYKRLGDGTEGFRLKTIKFRGQISQGLALPVHILGKKQNDFKLGDDISEELGVIKYEPPSPASLAGEAKGPYLSLFPKTDEERIQNLTECYETWKDLDFYVTEKLDGTSITIYLNNGDFGICTRNFELKEDKNITYWKVAKELNLKERLSMLHFNVAIQGELIGEGVQTNLYKIRGQTIKFFDVYNIDEKRYLFYKEMMKTISKLGFEAVPLVEENFKLPNIIDELLLYADGQSILNPQASREGIVLRTKKDKRVSFKVISNLFLLKEK